MGSAAAPAVAAALVGLPLERMRDAGFGGGAVVRRTIGGGGGGAGLGGAIFNYGGTVSIFSSTISGNTAVGGPAGTPNAADGTGLGMGGGIFSRNGVVNIFNSTIAGNRAAHGGGGVYALGDGGSASLVMHSTIVADSILTTSDVRIGTIRGGTAASAGTANLIEGNSGFAGAAINVDPGLSGLASNGGATQTHAIGATSAAVDAGSNPLGVLADQRLFVRPSGTLIDIGAYEFQSPPPTTTPAEDPFIPDNLGDGPPTGDGVDDIPLDGNDQDTTDDTTEGTETPGDDGPGEGDDGTENDPDADTPDDPDGTEGVDADEATKPDDSPDTQDDGPGPEDGTPDDDGGPGTEEGGEEDGGEQTNTDKNTEDSADGDDSDQTDDDAPDEKESGEGTSKSGQQGNNQQGNNQGNQGGQQGNQGGQQGNQGGQTGQPSTAAVQQHLSRIADPRTGFRDYSKVGESRFPFGDKPLTPHEQQVVQKISAQIIEVHKQQTEQRVTQQADGEKKTEAVVTLTTISALVANNVINDLMGFFPAGSGGGSSSDPNSGGGGGGGGGSPASLGSQVGGAVVDNPTFFGDDNGLGNDSFF